MNCLIILLLLACGGCRNGQGCGCGNMRSGNMCCQRDGERDNDCPCRGEGRGSARGLGNSEENDHHDHHDHEHCDHDRRQGGPAAWNSFPSISGGETCGCDAE